MHQVVKFAELPEIVVGEADHHQLTARALGGSGHTPDAADDLLWELRRALVVADADVPVDAVRLGSIVDYRHNGRLALSKTLSLGAEDTATEIGVLTPVGTALIGLRRGQAIRWADRAGRPQALSVVAVSQT